jgi:hypothetical protein
MSWRDKAACRGASLALFVITGARTTKHPHLAEALTYCDACPVRQACWEEAVRERDTDVVRGGREIREAVPVCRRCGAAFQRRRKASKAFCSDACREAAAAALAARKAKVAA